MNASPRRPGAGSGDDGDTGGWSVTVTLLGVLFGFDKRTVLILLWVLLVIAVLYGLVSGA